MTEKTLSRPSFLLQHRKLCRNIENYVATKFFVATEKLCRDKENYVVTKFSVAT